MSQDHKEQLLGRSEKELQDVARQLGAPTFVGKQLAQWIYKHGVSDFDQMLNLSQKLRTALKASYVVGTGAPINAQHASDGTIKYLFRTGEGHFIETVYIPDGKRATLCVSCQVGCKMHCAFCMTGRQGFKAQLSSADILNQIFSLPERDSLTNIVFMGQGEPLDNLDAVLQTTTVLTAPWGYAWSPKRITISTVGIKKGMLRLIEESQCHIAVSLHHPLSEGRAAIMPAEQAYSIEALVSLLEQFEVFRKNPLTHDEARQRRISFEYIVFKGINDSLRHADALIALLRGLDCRVNLIRFHDIPDTPLQGVSQEEMLRFRDYLTSHGLFATIRASRGQDIDAACGLLSTKEQEAACEIQDA